MRYMQGLLAGAVIASLATASAVAQTQTQKPVEPAAREHIDTKACAPRPETSGAPLSDKLASTDGVICPPVGVDPEIRAPAPQGGKMPVIPPPGSPGGDPTVRPK